VPKKGKKIRKAYKVVKGVESRILPLYEQKGAKWRVSGGKN
jgi:hypothetical protein